LKVRAAVVRQAGAPILVETLDLEPPRSGEVLVKIAATGVCHSDWHIATGDTEHPLPVALGHEGAGVVADVGDGVTRVQVGDHVALNWAPSCGSCFYCEGGRPSLCGKFVEPIWAGTMLDGTTRLSSSGEPVYHYSSLACFADHTVVPEVCCVPMPREVPFEIAALIGCAVTTGVGSVLNTACIEIGSSVCVYGVGGVGVSVILGARLAGASRIIAVDRNEEKLEIARGFGATDTALAGPDAVASIRQLTEGRGADYVFEAVGAPRVQEECLHAARPGGTVVLVGLSPTGSATNLPGAIITRQEKTIVGSYYGTCVASRDFPQYAKLYLDGDLDLDRLVSRTYALDEINDAYAAMLSGGTARGVVLFEAPKRG
jgi:Zn-dependent alcohol dehydrogenase